MAALLILQLLRSIPIPAAAPVVATVIGGGLAVLGVRWRATAMFWRYLSPSILIFPVLFLVRPPVSTLVWPEGVEVGSGVASDSSVVVIVFDELPLASLLDRHGSIDVQSYPGFARLASISTWFRNTTTVAEGTPLAVPAILTGRFPDPVRLPVAADHPDNLFTWLGPSHDLNVFETVTRLCPQALDCTLGATPRFHRLAGTVRDLGIVYRHLVTPAEWTSQLPAIDGGWRDFHHVLGHPASGSGAVSRRRLDRRTVHRSQGDIPWIVDAFSDRLEVRHRPTLHWLHLNLPHLPWKYLPSGRQYGPTGAQIHPRGLMGREWQNDPWMTVQALQRHLLQLRYADRVLDRLLDRMEATGLLDRAVLVVTADHGTSFWPGQPRREVSDRNRSEILMVPLFLRVPGIPSGRIDDQPAQTLDIVPTLAAALGAPPPWSVDGRSLLDPKSPVRDRYAYLLAVGEGGPIPLAVQLDDLMPAVRKRLRVFGDRGDLFRFGPHPELFGRPLSGLEVEAGGRLRKVVLTDSQSFESVVRDSGFLPARVVGRFEAGAGPGVVAVAVNGVLQATVRTGRGRRGSEDFEAMVPESAWRDGFNRVEIFEVEAGRAGTVLRPTERLRETTYSLDPGADGAPAAIVRSTGGRFQLDSKAMVGEAYFDGVMIRGWAVALEEGRVPDAVLMFYDDAFVNRSAFGKRRPEVAGRFALPAVERSGFGFVAPIGRLGRLEASRVAIYALAGGKASRIPYSERVGT
ncbi:MAG: sulfatase-like hydrolase/transferase [Acidobacteriota bacterium]